MQTDVAGYLVQIIAAVIAWLLGACMLLIILWLFATVFSGNPIRALRRRLLSTFLLEHVGALARLRLPLTQAVSACSARLWPGSRHDLQDVDDSLSDGFLLGDALGRVPLHRSGIGAPAGRLFHAIGLVPYPRLVTGSEAEVLRIGEMSGDLGRAVRLVLAERRRTGELRTWLFAALFYALAIFLIGGGIMSGIFVFIVPKFKKMFDELDMALPTMTQMLLRLASAQWYLLTLMLIALIAILVTRAGRLRPLVRRYGGLGQLLRRAIYFLPFHVGAMRRTMLAEFCTELAMLLRIGTPAHRALEVIAEGTMNPWFRDRVRRVADACNEGVALPEALDQAGLDRRAAWFGRAAGDAPDLAESLRRLADDYRTRVSWAMSLAVRVVPPLMILGLGMAVGFVVIALFVPLVKLTSSFGGGS